MQKPVVGWTQGTCRSCRLADEETHEWN